MNRTQYLNRTTGIKSISIVNGIAAVLHLSFWILAFLHLSKNAPLTNLAEKINLATVYGFGIADIIWSFTFLAFGSIGLWKMKAIGWLCAQLANVLYWYSFTVIITRDIASGRLAPGTILFLPFALFSFWAAYYLWQKRMLVFGNSENL